VCSFGVDAFFHYLYKTSVVQCGDLLPRHMCIYIFDVDIVSVVEKFIKDKRNAKARGWADSYVIFTKTSCYQCQVIRLYRKMILKVCE